MTVSMNSVSSSNLAQNVADPKVKIIMGCLCQKISGLFTEKMLDKAVQPLEFTRELLKLKKQDTEEETITLISSKYGSVVDQKTGGFFASLLHKLPESPIEIGLEYIQKAPGYDPVKGFQVPNDWDKNETVTLNQIYKEQFFGWILKNSQLPFSSILNMLHILKSFDDPSIQLDKQIWGKFLLTEKRQKQLKEFQSKYDFLMNNKFLHSFPIELEKITITCDIQKPIKYQYELFEGIFKWLVEQLLEDVQTSNDSQASNIGQTLKNTLENFPKKDLSIKVLAYKLKKVLPFLQAKFISLIEYIEGNKARLKELEEQQTEVAKVLVICKEKEEQIKKERGEHNIGFNIKAVMDSLLVLYKELTEQGVSEIERDARFNQQLHSTLKEQMTTLEHVQETEAYFIHQKKLIEKNAKVIQQELSTNMHLLEADFSRIHFLINHMDTGIAKEQARWKGERFKLSSNQFDEMLEREFVAECKVSSSKASKTPQRPLDFSDEEEPVSLDEEEESVALFEQPASSSTHAPKLYTDEQIQSYLSNKAKNKQLNGALSQSVESLLQQIRPHLHQKQGKEVYDHALLGAAALEQMAQAIYENRIDHVVLGFRSSLIHCHFAVEQMLSQEIFQKTGIIADSHNLTFLANTLVAKTQKPFSKEEQEFLEEVRVHLWFHYPEDYRLYFAYNNAIPKAFSLLETLSQPGINKENVQEAMRFAFEKYYQTLELITKLSEAPAQNSVELFKSNLSDLQKHINAIAVKPRKLPVNKSSLIPKIDRALEKLISLDQLIHIKDLEDGWLLAIFDSIKSYLQLMKVSLETPQKATKHSLQKFIQVETLLNMEKLFKNLFRTVSFLHLEGDTRTHSLNRFYSAIQEFYEKPLSKADRSLLKSINLSTTHHYFHKKSHADLNNAYSHFLDEARALSSVNEEFPEVTTKSGNISVRDLQKKMEESGQLMQTMDKSLGLFKRLLDPVIVEVQKINNDIEKELNRLQIG